MPYGQTIDERFCSFTAIMSDLGGDRLLPVAVKWLKIFDDAHMSKWHLIPAQPNQRKNLPDHKLVYDGKREAVFARYFGQNLLLATGALLGELIDRAVSVPVPKGSLQGLHPRFTLSAREATKEKLDVAEYNAAMAYLKDNGWWNITRPVDTAEDMMDLLQPLLACESWDWHGAATAKVMLHWAGLLSIVSLEKEANVGKFSRHVGNVESWQDDGSNYLCHVPLARTLEGSPRSHPSNVNVHYLKGKEAWLTVQNIESEADKLDEMFNNLLADGRTPMRQTTANTCASLNGMQVASAEVKTSWDGSNAGFDQQALLLTDFFSRLNPREAKPKVAIGLHLNNEHVKIQTLQLEINQHRVPRTLMSRYVYESVLYTLRLSEDAADRQDRACMPAICYREGGTEKAMPALEWGTVKPRFQPYLVAIIQVLCKLRALYAENEYSLQLRVYMVGKGNDNKWANCTGLLHQTPRGDKLPQSMQNCYYEEGFMVYQRVRKQWREDSMSSESDSGAMALGS